MKSKEEKTNLISKYRYYILGILNAVDEDVCERALYYYENSDMDSAEYKWAFKILNRISRKIDDAVASERDNFIV